MARSWASEGFPVLRFDYRGMGDSTGEARNFESVEDDIRAAIDTLMREVPSLTGVVVFGLCDAASAALIYGAADVRVRGLMLANPWVRTPEGEARSFVRHYYGARLLQGSFWRKVFAGEFQIAASVRGFFNSWFLSRRVGAVSSGRARGRFIDRMLSGLQEFSGPALILISEHDLTAKEFTDLCGDDPAWTAARNRPNVMCETIGGADHTFASRKALQEALRVSLAWLDQYKKQ